MSRELENAIEIAIEILLFSMLVFMLAIFSGYSNDALTEKKTTDNTVEEIREYREIYRYTEGTKAPNQQLEWMTANNRDVSNIRSYAEIFNDLRDGWVEDGEDFVSLYYLGRNGGFNDWDSYYFNGTNNVYGKYSQRYFGDGSSLDRTKSEGVDLLYGIDIVNFAADLAGKYNYFIYRYNELTSQWEMAFGVKESDIGLFSNLETNINTVVNAKLGLSREDSLNYMRVSDWLGTSLTKPFVVIAMYDNAEMGNTQDYQAIYFVQAEK